MAISLLVNNVCTKLTGYTRRKLVGCHFSFLFEENEYKQLVNKVRKNQRLKRLVQYQTFIKSKTENYLPIELSVIPVKKNRKLIGYQGIVRDISERLKSEKEQLRKSIEIQQINEELVKKNKKLQELHELKSQFVSNVGHELRTPLNGVLGYTELLKEGIYGNLNDEQNRALKHIINSGNHLLNLINELLDFAKIQSGKFKVYKDYSSVYDIVDAAISTIRPSLESKKLNLIKSIKPDLPRLFVDSQKIYQVLLNILSNSIKFTSEGEIELKVHKNNEKVRFSVRDTGIGISESEIEKIFIDFHQVDGSFTRNYGGTGLGLSLAKYLIEAHDGEIWVDSLPGSGSTFSFEVPIITQESDERGEHKQAFSSIENEKVSNYKQIVEK